MSVEEELKSNTLVVLRKLASDMGLKGYSKLKKDDLIRAIIPALEEDAAEDAKKEKRENVRENKLKEMYVPSVPLIRCEEDSVSTASTDGISEELKRLHTTDITRFSRVQQLGKKGKEGTVYLVIDTLTGKKCAMKTFRKQKSAKTLEKEANFQFLAAKEGISPNIIAYNTEEKYIVMDILSRTLMDILRDQNGEFTMSQQRQLIDLYKKLDRVGIMINDANPLNVMDKDGRLYLIDYGFAKYTKHKIFKKYTHPNLQLMPLGLLIWMNGRHPTKSWTYIRQQIDKVSYNKLGMDRWP